MTLINKGLFTDGNKMAIPVGAWSYAKNAVIVSNQTDFALTNERSHEHISSLPVDFVPIGQIYVGRDESILFITAIGSVAPSPLHRIVKMNRYGDISTVLSNNFLGFNITKQIKGTYALNSKGERIIYWVDDYNTPRFLNIDSPDSPITSDEISLFFIYKRPKIDLQGINDTGGSLKVGAYQFAIQIFDSDFNESNYLQFTNQVYVNDEVKSVSSNEYDGAESGISTSKSIALRIGELHGNVRYFRIAVIETINREKVYKIGDILPLPSNLSDFTYTYTGTQAFTEISIGELSKQFSSYSSAATIAQFRNRLLIGGLKQNLDVAYQPLANEIEVYYHTEEFDLSDKTKNYKNELMSFYKKSFRRDETYALGIVWLFDDGAESFSYHIPGRVKIEGKELSGGTDILFSGDDVYDNDPMWQGVSTADSETVGTGGIVVGLSSDYRLGYYESPTEVYPDTDEWADLAGQKVRHHKMPNINQSPHYRGTATGLKVGRRLGISVKNVQLPTSLRERVVGFKIVTVPINSSNKSVIGQGALFNYTLRKNEDGRLHVINSFPFSGKTIVNNCDIGSGDIRNEHSFYCPEYALDYGEEVVPDYMQQEAIVYASDSNGAIDGENNAVELFSNEGITTLGEVVTLRALADSGDSLELKRRALEAVYKIPHNTENIDLETVILNNRNGPSHLSTIHADEPLEYANVALDDIYGINPGVYSMEAIDAHENEIRVYILTNLGFAYYISTLKKKYYDQYPNINNLEYIDSAYTYYFPDEDSKDDYDPLTAHKGASGDTFISNFWFRRTVGGNRDYFGGNDDSGIDEDDENAAQVKAMNWIALESAVNADFRNSGVDRLEPNADISTKYYPKFSPIYSFTDDNTILQLPAFYDNHWEYNKDFHAINDFKIYISTPLNLVQATSFGNRIAYSELKTSEDIFDSYRRFLSNNYKDIPQDKGVIIDMFIKDSKLHVHTEDSLFVIPADELKIETSEGLVNVNTGAFLIQSAYEITTIEDGYAGLHSRWANVITPYGYAFVDSDRGGVFLYNNTMEDISRFGMRTFWRDNGDIILKREMGNIGEDLNYRNPVNPYGVGYSIDYDRILNRLLIHKKDFSFVQPELYTDPIIPLTAGYFQYMLNKFYVWEYEDVDSIIEAPDENGNMMYLNTLSFTREDYFKDESFTYSFSFENKGWVGQHDYKPVITWRNTDLFSINAKYPDGTQTKAYKHNTGDSYGDFGYEEKGKFEIELVFNQPSGPRKRFNSIVLKTICTNEENVLKASTFNNFLIYNSYQCSGYVNIVNRKTASYVAGRWQINKFRDLVDDYEEPFIDNGVPISDNINPNKHYTLKKIFEDDYIACRLSYDNESDFKLSLYEADALTNLISR